MLAFETCEDRRVLATFTVNSLADPGDGTCDAAECTLREAISTANANAGTDSIHFAMLGAAPHVLTPLSPLPAVSDPVVIDGTTQPGYVNSPLIVLDGSLAGSASGLTLSAGSSTVRGLVINQFSSNGILITGVGGNVVESNFIGTDFTGTSAVGTGNGLEGIRISSSSDNRVGTDGDGTNDTNERNVISGNGRVGVFILGAGAEQNVVAGNHIGVDRSGGTDLGNAGAGVLIQTTRLNRVGTDGDGSSDDLERNLISGNAQGVYLSDADENLVSGNYIGTDSTGTSALGNGTGILIADGSLANDVGGITAAERNVISGNSGDGVQITSDGTASNLVRGNYIGLDSSGELALGQGGDGVDIQGTRDNRIGGDLPGEGNVISANNVGVRISYFSSTRDGADTVVQGNFIGTNKSGTVALGNASSGVVVNGAVDTLIGGATSGSGNLISGNGIGLNLLGSTAGGNRVMGNLVGTDVLGTATLGNSQQGVILNSAATAFVVGTDGDGTDDFVEGNVIAFNGLSGVEVGDTSSGNSVRGNSLHSNGKLGIDLDGGSEDGFGVTSNDTGDADTGPNGLQNYPVLTLAASGGSTTTIEGSLNSSASTAFDLDFYSSTTADASGFGEGRVYLGSMQVVTDSGGNVTFTTQLSASVTPGHVLSATATGTGGTSEFSAAITVAANQPPTADAGPAVSVDEGGTVSLDGSGSSDPDQDDSTLTYEWDLDGDGLFGETGAGAVRGDEVGATPVFDAAGMDGPDSVIVTLRVTDDGGLTDEDTTSVSVDNVAPVILTLSNSSPGCGGAEIGESVTLSGTFNDAGVPDTHTVSISWGDGVTTGGTAAGGNLSGSHPYAEGGSYTVTVTLTDDDGDSVAGTTTIIVIGAGVNDGELQIVGTDADDDVHVNMPDGSTFRVHANFLSGGQTDLNAAGVMRITAMLCAGNDRFSMSGSIETSAWVDGGAGADKLKGAGGDDVILGRDGDDLLIGKSGRDLLIGGLGADRIVGNADDDIIIGGFTAFDDDTAALDAIMAEWTSSRDYETRVANLSGTGSGPRENGTIFLQADGSAPTVSDDDARDVITGSSGLDWFFANLDSGVKDKITDLNDEEFAVDLDWILAP